MTSIECTNIIHQVVAPSRCAELPVCTVQQPDRQLNSPSPAQCTLQTHLLPPILCMALHRQ